MNKNTKTAAKSRRQVGALPYKVVDDTGVEVMLVTSRETKRWIIPKGWPMKDRKPYVAAKREAFEEAGVRGQIGKRPIGTFVYDKRLKSQATVSCKVEVFPLKVRKQAEVWPERSGGFVAGNACTVVLSRFPLRRRGFKTNRWHGQSNPHRI